MALPEISIITATYNRAELLLQKLESLKSQTLLSDRFEWIVCINGSTDKTREIFQDIQMPFNIKVIDFETNQGISKGRNACVKEAKGKILYFSDDDCILQKNTLERHLLAQENLCVAIGGIRFEANTVTLWQPQKVNYWNLNGANSSVPKGAFEKVDGFDERLTGYGGEDLLLGYRLKQSGLKFRRLGGMVNHRGPNPMDAQDLIKAQDAGKNAVRIVEFYPELAFRLGVHPGILKMKKILLPWLKMFGNTRVSGEWAYVQGALEEWRLRRGEPK